MDLRIMISGSATMFLQVYVLVLFFSISQFASILRFIKKNTWLLKAMKINFVLHVLSGFPMLYASELAPGFCTSVLCI